MTPDTTRAGEYRAAGDTSTSAAAIGAQAAGQAAAENFPVALRLLPRRYRGHLAAVYGFARTADDMGDEAAPAERLGLLDELEADLRRLYRLVPSSAPGKPAGEREDAPRLPVVRALAATVVACQIPAQPFLDLIEANRQDQVVSRYPVYDGLLAYCRLSANPVGRIVLHVFGAATPEREALSDQVCTALQLAEHWQDVAEDFGRGRIYLPQEDMARFGVTEADLAGCQTPGRVRELLVFEVERVRRLLDEGRPLVRTLSGWGRVAVAGYVGGGYAALDAIRRTGYDVLGGPPQASKPAMALAALRELR